MEMTTRNVATAQLFSLRRVALTATLIAIIGFSMSVVATRHAGAASSRTAKRVVVAVSKNATLGSILVSNGRALYSVNTGNCDKKCRKIWPELVLPKGVKKATPGTGVKAAKLGTRKVAGGAVQVTYSGKAVYFFVGDTSAGQANGNGVTDVWGKWSVLGTARLVQSGSPTTPIHTTTPPATSVPTPGSSSTTPSVSTPAKPTTSTQPPTTTAPKPTTPSTAPAPAPAPTPPPKPTTPTTTAPPTTTTTAPPGGGSAF